MVARGTVIITIVLSTLGGYGFSRFNFPGKDALFITILATLMIPFQSILIPLFLVLRILYLQNTLLGLMLVYTTFQLPFGVFVMRNAFDSVPREIEEAGLIFMTDSSKFTLPIMLLNASSGQFGAIDWGMLQAGITISMLPCLLLFLFLQRYYVSGLAAGAVKA